jgi:hypothetical protein
LIKKKIIIKLKKLIKKKIIIPKIKKKRKKIKNAINVEEMENL